MLGMYREDILEMRGEDYNSEITSLLSLLCVCAAERGKEAKEKYILFLFFITMASHVVYHIYSST